MQLVTFGVLALALIGCSPPPQTTPRYTLHVTKDTVVVFDSSNADMWIADAESKRWVRLNPVSDTAEKDLGQWVEKMEKLATDSQ